MRVFVAEVAGAAGNTHKCLVIVGMLLIVQNASNCYRMGVIVTKGS